LLFETQSLCKYYRAATRAEVCAVDDVSLAIERGSFTALIGASGSGKTTLLALLGALEWPTRGEVLFLEKSLGGCSDAELARIRRRMGFVFQDFSLIPTLSAGENIAYPLIPRGVPRAERDRRAGDLLARLGMEGRLGARPRELSGGEQQRVAIARALAGQPEVIFADEPTSNLDPDAGQSLLTILRELHVQGTTLVFATHEPQVKSLATHVFELRAGRLVSATM
jgi:putative ABC transport system ATP-binding protein